MTITPQVRLAVLLSFLASLVTMAGLYFLLRAQLAESTQAAPAPVVRQPAAPAAPAAPVIPAKPAQQPATAPQAKPTPAPKPAAPAGPRIAKGLPPALTAALKEHRIVVAVLTVPGARLDATVVAEATAGAEQAGVGFVRLDVLREKTGRALAAKLGVVETPTVIVYRRPGKVVTRFQGLVDSATVRQAIATARGR